MEEARCAWCGERLKTPATAKSFCGKACQRAHEDWCRSRAVARTQAVYRWRDVQVVNSRDMVNDLLSAGQRTPEKRRPGSSVER
jgi:hypothetical protein